MTSQGTIVEAHGGKIEAGSGPDGGTTFRSTPWVRSTGKELPHGD